MNVMRVFEFRRPPTTWIDVARHDRAGQRGRQKRRISGKSNMVEQSVGFGEEKTNTKDKQNMRISCDICRIQRQISSQIDGSRIKN